jgi:SAM-dependent methyltransferase
MSRALSFAYYHVYHRIDAICFRRIREKLAPLAEGETLEIGVGTGLNFPHLPGGIRYAGIEPDPTIIAYARRRREWPLVLAPAERLPFRDRQFDTVLSTFTFCTVMDPARAAAEVARVLKGGGTFLFLEHVRAEGAFWRRAQKVVSPCWSMVLGNCHVDRPTLETLARAGLDVEELHRASGGLLPIVWGKGSRKK